MQLRMRNPTSEAELDLLRRFPEYRATRYCDVLRADDHAQLDASGHVYLDFTGGGLYAESLLRAHHELLRGQVLGNPHSANPASAQATELVERTRAQVLAFFGASPAEYEAIFTANATGALKLVGEAYPFQRGDRLLLSFDNHNSVNGIREYARRRGAEVAYAPLSVPELRLDEAWLDQALRRRRGDGHHLFAYPAQSNFTGVQHPLAWVARAQARGWEVLLDAAAFVPTNRLDLGEVKPDFVSVSFYKMFGYPTGVGCLLVRRPALSRLRRPWYAGGTITFSSVQGQGHYLTPGAAGFEDGTVNYLSIPAVGLGLAALERLGLDLVNTRVRCLTEWLLDRLAALRHGNGAPLVLIHGPLDGRARGATVAFNLHDARGRRLDGYAVEARANARRISLRTGCHCNPGAREVALGFDEAELAACFREKEQCSHEAFLERIEGKTTGAIRASLGAVSNVADLEALLRFLATYLEGGDHHHRREGSPRFLTPG
jgi:selenocysteine lyase/cysteine desulfurase